MPPVPKRKLSKSRTKKRRSSNRPEFKSIMLCPKCKAEKLPHRACPECGFYK